MSIAADVRMQGFRTAQRGPRGACMDRQQCEPTGRRVRADRRRDGPRARVGRRRADRRAGIRSLGDGRLRRARRRHLGRERVQPDRASRRRPGRCPAQPFDGAVAPGTADPHHDRARRCPQGVDAVVPAEYAIGVGGTASRSRGRSRPASTSAHRGEDIAAGRRRAARGPAPARAGRRRSSRRSGIAHVDASSDSRACASSPPATRWWHPARRRTCTRSTTRTPTCCAAFSRATAACSSARCGWATILPRIREALHRARRGRDPRLREARASGSEDHAPRLVAEMRRARDSWRRDAAVESRGRGTHRRRRSCSCCPAIPFRACARTISSPGARSGS